MKTISFLIYSMDIGGAEKVTHDLINQYVSDGFNVFLFCLTKTGSFLHELKIPEENIYEVGKPSSIKNIFKISNNISKLLYETKTDYFFSMGEWPNVISPFVKYGGKYAIVEHSTKTFFTSPKDYHLPLSIRILSNIAYKKAPKILCVSRNIKNLLVLKNKALAAKTEVVYNPINFDNVSRLSCEKINYNTKKFKIISVSRFSKPKNLHLLLQAFSEVRKDFTDTELWLVGDGEMRKGLEKLTEKLKIKDSVIFFGFQENPYKFISKADLFVLSSDYEGFSLVICETLFLHKRVVTTRCNSDLDDLITPDYGVIVPIGNKKELINAIKREVMTRKNVENIPGLLNRFSIKTVANKYLDYLNGNE